jgi:hypothetical protein
MDTMNSVGIMSKIAHPVVWNAEHCHVPIEEAELLANVSATFTWSALLFENEKFFTFYSQLDRADQFLISIRLLDVSYRSSRSSFRNKLLILMGG